MRVLIGCEYSGTVRDAFLALGHDAMSCDLLPTDVPGPHYQGDVRDVIDDGWDLAVFHPDCTYLCRAGQRWLSSPTDTRPGKLKGLPRSVKTVFNQEGVVPTLKVVASLAKAYHLTPKQIKTVLKAAGFEWAKKQVEDCLKRI